MNCATGQIASIDLFRKTIPKEDFERLIQPVDVTALSPFARETLQRTGTVTIGRNSRCACGSGKKFKRCCYKPE